MKRIKNLRSGIICLLAMFYVMVQTSFIAYAEEGDDKELSFNSVIEVENYSIEEGCIEAGKEANISITLKNANRNSAANNLVVVVNSNSGKIFPAYGQDNQFFIGTLAANSTTTVTIPVVVDSSFTADFADLICNIMYVANGRQITNSSTMVLPAKGVSTILVNSIDVSAHATVNAKSLLSIGYYNKSEETIGDAVIVVDGAVSDSSRIIELGTIMGKKFYTKDFNIIFSNPGEQTITISIKYTDTDGEMVKEELGTFNVTVGKENGSKSVVSEENSALVWGGRAIAALGFLGVVIVVWLHIKKRK